MSVRTASKRELTTALRERYWKASHSERGQMLDTFCEATGYHRKYAMTVLRHGPPADRPRLVQSGRSLTHSPLVIHALGRQRTDTLRRKPWSRGKEGRSPRRISMA
jgi:hypothetical protein